MLALSVIAAAPLMTLYTGGVAAVETQYENYVSGALEGAPFTTFGWDYHAQTFWVSASHNVNAVQLKMYRQAFGLGGSAVVSIRATEGATFSWGDAEVPMGSDLAGGSISMASITTSTSGAWYEILLSDTVQLTAGKEYAVVVGSTGDPIKWKAAKTYLNGNAAASLDRGATWPQADPEYDFLFQVWGDPEITGSLATATGSGVVDIMPDSGEVDVTSMQALDLSELSQEAQDSVPLSGDFVHGFMGFDITGVVAGGSVTVTLIFPDNVGVGSQYWKYYGGSWVRIPIGSNDGDNVITITLVDGGLGDSDGIDDGTIRDPGGPAMILFGDGFEEVGNG